MSNLFYRFLFTFFCLSIFSCNSSDLKQKNLSVKFLSEFILPDNLLIDGTLVGGLSGIDFYNNQYYLVCDDSKTPRVYFATIDIPDTIISNISIDSVLILKDSLHFLDLESIRYNSQLNEIILTSEGHINTKKSPSLFSINERGNLMNLFQLPISFHAESNQMPRHNGTLEGLTISYDKSGYWLGMELPLKSDGPEPKFEETKSPVRITYIDDKTEKAEKQFSYFLDPIAKKPNGKFAVNGLTDLIEYKKDVFIVIERSYSSGYGNQGNTIKLFRVDSRKASNTLGKSSLKDSKFTPAKKELLLNFDEFKSRLINKSIDNIEGITLGPKLSNGNNSLILVSDNNFNRMEKQLNQFILLELIEN
jgi:hypothetical protein